MKWIRRCRGGRREQTTASLTDATESRERAERELEWVRAQTPVYRRFASDLRLMREENHIAEHIEAQFRGGQDLDA